MHAGLAEILFYAGIPVALAFGLLAVAWLGQRMWRKGDGVQHTLRVVYRGPFLLALCVMVAGLALAVQLAESARKQSFEDAKLRFLNEAELVEASFEGLIGNLVYPLDMVRGVFVANPDMTGAQFSRVVRQSLRDGEYPGTHGVSFVERVNRRDLAAFVAAQRAGGAAQFAVHGTGSLPDLLVTRFIEPMARNEGALGQDLGANPALREAAEEAMRSGRPVLSRRVALLQDSLGRPSFVYFMPIYTSPTPPDTEAQRVRLLRGWAAVPVVLSELMSQGNVAERHMANFQLYDGDEESNANLIYDSELPSGDALGPASLQRYLRSRFSVIRPLMVADRVYYLRSNSTPTFEASYVQRDHVRIAFIGSSLSVLVAMVLWLLLVGRARAMDIAAGMTADLDRLALVARRTSNAVIFSDAHGLITWVNEGFARITGYLPDDVVNRQRDNILLSPHIDPEILELLRTQARAEGQVHEVISCRRKDGQLYWADLEMQAIRASDGKVLAYMTLQSDVTEEVRAKEALEVEKERAEDILTGANVGTWESNLVTGASQFNDRWAAMMGFSREDVVPDFATFWRNRLHPDDCTRVVNATGACASGATEGYSFDVRVRRKDGSWMWILARAKVMSRSPDGGVEWIGGIHTDISEFKHVENSLRDMEAFLDRAGRIAGVGAWQVDLRSGKVIFSDQTCAIYGVEPGYSPTLEQALSYYPVPERQRLQVAMDRALELGLAWDLELEFTNAQGEQLWVRQFGEVEFDDAGAVRLVGAFQDVTRDRAVRLEVQRSGELLRGAIDAINEAFVLYDPQDRLVFCNDKYRALYSKSADLMVVGATFESILLAAAERGQYPEAAGNVQEWVRRQLQSHRQGNFSLEQQTEDGRWLKVLERKMPDGHSVGFRVDITELKLATAAAESVSAALAEQRRRLQSILEGTNVGTWEWNVQTGEMIYNDQYESMLGYRREELGVGGVAHWRALCHPLDAARAESKMIDHLAGATVMFENEVRVRHHDGRWIWLLGRGKLASRTGDGAPLWVYGTHMDITERKLAETELAETSATLQNVLDSATQVGVICMGVDRVIQVFNRGAENLLGYQASELIGRKTCSPFFDLAELAALRESLELVYGRVPSIQEIFEHVVGTREQQEWTFIRKNGTRFIASLIFSPVRNAQGEVDGHLAVVYDVSKQKEYETSLRQAMQLAEQSSVAKSQFLANMSHEIRTPMNAILGMLQLLHQTSLNARQRDYTGKAEGAARSLLGLLNDILDFSKVEAGKMQLDPQPFVLEDLLADLSVILSSNLGKKEVDLLFVVDPAIPRELVGDSLRLKQILINLGGNAVKFTQEGEVQMRWTLLASSPQRVRLGIAVQDTGIGIAPENQTRIFEAFTQAESNTTRRFGGTGLGLVISTRLIRLMGGELELVSAVGKGSTFSFTLDLPLPAKVGASDAAALALLPAPDGPGVSALVVDDSAVARESAAVMMRSLGWQVQEAASGAAALELLQACLAAQAPLPHALFVDWQMPGMDGWETLARVRQLLDGRAQPWQVLLSRHNRESLASRSEQEQEQLDGFIVKPFTASMFAQALEMAQSQSGAVHAAPAAGMRPLQGMRLLLVEDNPINQQVAQELLASAGAEVTLADNGLLGLQALDAAQPMFDAVLMDLQMPEMDGLTAARHIRENLRFAQLPVIAMTANAMAGDREVCLQAGMNDHVGKPFDIEDLIRVLIANTGWVSVPGAAEAALPLESDTPDGALQAPDATAWPQGIEVDKALARMGENHSLLLRSFQAYLREVEGLEQRVRQAQGLADPSALKRELHSFKGLSATLGVTALSELAASAETLAGVETAQPACAEATRALLEGAQRLLPVLRTVARRLGASTETQHGRALQNALPVQALRELLVALKAWDMRAMELHSALRAPAGSVLAAALSALDSAVASLDFDGAARECEKLLSDNEASV